MNRFIAWLTGLHQHRCRTESDETGIWGECIVCHQRFGYVTRAELRRYADREIDREIEKRTGLKP